MNKPVVDGHHCGKCPYLVKYQHPFFHYTAWCWHQMKDLSFYDYWLADCIDGEPDEKLLKIQNSGVTKPPK